MKIPSIFIIRKPSDLYLCSKTGEDLVFLPQEDENFLNLVTETNLEAITSWLTYLKSKEESSEEFKDAEVIEIEYFSSPLINEMTEELHKWRTGHQLQGFQEDLLCMQGRALDAEKLVEELKIKLTKSEERVKELESIIRCFIEGVFD